jgi:methyl-accepting chemotaxis protein
MLGFGASDSARTLAAMGRSLAVIEFDLSGRILTANQNFCRAMGYALSEIVGQHHSLFVAPDMVQSAAYKAFWAQLGRGEFVAEEFVRIAKDGRQVWLQASYNPVTTAGGKVYKVVKIATDITAAKLKAAENAGKMDAIARAQGVIEFTLDGQILTANPNFLKVVGYSLDEVVGKHHRLFVDPAFAASPDYAEFWAKLRRGEFVAEEFRRIGKGGKAVHIQASYNPIFDSNGAVTKVVKFAVDVSARVNAVNELGAGLGRLAEGDLTRAIDKAFLPALEPLRVSYNISVDRLGDTLRAVADVANGIHAGADQIRLAADDLSSRTEQQAAAIEETAAALAEITTAVKTSSQRADEVGRLVNRAKAGAERSGQVVTRAIDSMAAIEKSSEEVGKIIGVIDEIAFQTNLLALNAGVEAARAGEAGRGFAVVAQEVRGLAQRSAEAAKEIKSLISTSSKQVADGVELVGETGRALQVIVAEVDEIDGHVNSIVASARSQATGLNEINIAVGTLNQGTQQNAAMVEESTAASNELAAEVVELNLQLGKFRTDRAPAAHQRQAGRSGSPVHDLESRVVAAFPRAVKG